MTERLRANRAFALSILAGLIAGGILAGINLALVQPYTNALAEIELESLLANGEFDEDEYDVQLQSIYFSQRYGSIIIGLLGGALLGSAFAISRIRMSPLKTAILIAGIAWFVLYVIPAMKYPPSPEAIFDPVAASIYLTYLAGYTAVSGLSAVGIAFVFRKVKRKEKVFGAAALYLAVVGGAFFAFPEFHSEDDPLLPQPILNGWRSAISLSMTAFWFVLGAISGVLWTHGSKNYAKSILNASANDKN